MGSVGPRCCEIGLAIVLQNKAEVASDSPPCSLFSQMQHLNDPPDPERLKEAISFIELCVSFARAQMRAGRLFVLEQPAYATSWDIPCLDELKNDQDIYMSVLHIQDLFEVRPLQYEHVR